MEIKSYVLTIKDYSGNGNDGKLYGDTKALMNFDNNTIEDKTSYSRTATPHGGLTISNNCISNSCINGDGIDDYLILNISSGEFNKQKYSYSLWFQLNQTNYSSTKALIRGNSQSPRVSIWEHNSSHISLSFQVLNLSNSWSSSNKLFRKNNSGWNMITHVIDDGIHRGYINSDLFFEKNYTGELKNINFFEFLKRDNIHFLKAKIDEFGLYNRILSQNEINNLYISKKAQFVEFEDSSLDKAVVFNGGDYIQIPYDSTLSVPNFNEETLVVKFKKTNYNAWSNFLSYYPDSSPIHRFEQRGTQDSFIFYTGLVLLGFYNFVENKEFVIISTFKENNQTKLYVNNILVDNKATGSYSIHDDFGDWFIGARHNSSSETSYSIIDEVRIYDRELSSEEVNILSWQLINNYNKGINKINIESCNLSSNQEYEIVVFTNSGQKIEQEVYTK